MKCWLSFTIVLLIASAVGAQDVGPRPVRVFPTNDVDRTFKVAFTADGERLLTSGMRGVKIWNVNEADLSFTFTGHDEYVRALAISPDDELVVSGDYSGKVVVWSLTDTQILHVLESSPGHITSAPEIVSLAFAPNGRWIAGAPFDALTRIWDAQTGEVLHVLDHASAGRIESVAFSPDSTELMTAVSLSVWTWDAPTGELIVRRATAGPYPRINHQPYGADYSADGRFVILTHRNVVRGDDLHDETHVLSADSWETLGIFEGGGLRNTDKSFVMSPDSSKLLTASRNGLVRVWDVFSGELLLLFQSTSGEIYSVDVSADWKWLALGGYREVTLWDLQDLLLRSSVEVWNEYP